MDQNELVEYLEREGRRQRREEESKKQECARAEQAQAEGFGCLMFLVMGAIGFWMTVTAIAAFVYAYPLISALIGVGIVTVIAIYFVRVNRPKPVVGHFPQIVIPERVGAATRVAEANEAWWLVIPGARIAAVIVSLALSICSGLLGVLGLLFSDYLAAAFVLVPGLGETLAADRIYAWMLVALVFFAFAFGSLRETLWRAWNRNEAMRSDPRSLLLRRLNRLVAWWNKHLPNFNDFAVVGGNPDRMERLMQAQAVIIARLKEIDARLAVAPLGSFPIDRSPVPVPEFVWLDALVDDLRHQSALLKIQEEIDDLGHPDRIPDPKTAAFWGGLARHLGLKLRART